MGTFVGGRGQESLERIHAVAPHSRTAIGRVPRATSDHVEETEGEPHSYYSVQGGTNHHHVPRCQATGHKDSTGSTHAG